MDDDDFLNEETMDFVQLWDYAQSLPNLDEIFSPDDVVLLNEMVIAQNFAIALDLVRHRLKPRLKNYPDEIKDLIHASDQQKRKCIRVNPPPDFAGGPPSLEEFRATEFIGLPPPPSLLVSGPGGRAMAKDENFVPPLEFEKWNTGEEDEIGSYCSENDQVKNLQEEEEKQRRELMEKQDMEYVNALIADTAQFSQSAFSQPQPAFSQSDLSQPEIEKVETYELPVKSSSADGGVQVLIILPDRRLELVVDVEKTRLKNLARWVWDQTQTQYSTFFTTFPRVEWDLEKFLHELPVHGKKLLLMANE